MSQIDEAFIRAYATPEISPAPPTSAPVSDTLVVGAPLQVARRQQSEIQSQSPLAGLHAGPHIRLPSAADPPSEAQPAAWTPEPIPTPHFHLPSADDQDTMYQTATVAAPTPVGTQVVTTQTIAAMPVEPANQRRPLSTFSPPERPVTTEFNPVFEVDAFRWPKITDDLLSAHHPLLTPVAEQLLTVSEAGRSLVGVAGTRLGIGCTTVQMCLARMIADAGKSVVLVDANFAQARLARDLGLEFDTGWEDVLTGRLPLAECVVNSLQDRMALLPLAQPNTAPAELLASIQTSVTAGVLRYHYDLVLFNLGAAGQPPQLSAAQSVLQHCRLDASIIVADTAKNGSADLAQIDPLMSLFGQTCLGVIGNSAA